MTEYLLSELLELSYQPSDSRAHFKGCRRPRCSRCPTQSENRLSTSFFFFSFIIIILKSLFAESFHADAGDSTNQLT